MKFIRNIHTEKIYKKQIKTKYYTSRKHMKKKTPLQVFALSWQGVLRKI